MVPEVHLERSEWEGKRLEVALEARRHLAYDVGVEADDGHAGESPLRSLLVGRDTTEMLTRSRVPPTLPRPIFSQNASKHVLKPHQKHTRV